MFVCSYFIESTCPTGPGQAVIKVLYISVDPYLVSGSEETRACILNQIGCLRFVALIIIIEII